MRLLNSLVEQYYIVLLKNNSAARLDPDANDSGREERDANVPTWPAGRHF